MSPLDVTSGRSERRIAKGKHNSNSATITIPFDLISSFIASHDQDDSLSCVVSFEFVFENFLFVWLFFSPLVTHSCRRSCTPATRWTVCMRRIRPSSGYTRPYCQRRHTTTRAESPLLLLASLPPSSSPPPQRIVHYHCSSYPHPLYLLHLLLLLPLLFPTPSPHRIFLSSLIFIPPPFLSPLQPTCICPAGCRSRRTLSSQPPPARTHTLITRPLIPVRTSSRFIRPFNLLIHCCLHSARRMRR